MKVVKGQRGGAALHGLAVVATVCLIAACGSDDSAGVGGSGAGGIDLPLAPLDGALPATCPPP
jgi:hypothetical protein